MKCNDFERSVVITAACAALLWVVGFSDALASDPPFKGDFYICARVYHTENLDPTFVCSINGAYKEVVDTRRVCHSNMSLGNDSFGDSMCPTNVIGR